MRRCVADGRVLVIGYGNPLRGDDGLGPAAAEELLRVVGERSVEVVTPHQLVPELVEAIAGAGLVIFVDAGVGDGPPGSVVESRLTAGDEGPSVGPVGHHQTPAALMAAVGAMYGRCPGAIVFSVVGAEFEFGVGLSSRVQEVVPELVAAMAVRIREHLASGE
jgi:hydrogenase maturation protease